MSVNKGKIIVCYPVVQGSGCKYTATNIAHYYKAINGDKKVALVDLDFKSPYLAHALSLHDGIHGIDNLIDKIDGGFLTEDLFLENMIKLKDNVDLLKGTKLVGNHKIFGKKHIETILNQLQSIYDIVIVAVSPDLDNAGTVYSLFQAEEVILVCRNNFSNFRTIDKAVSYVKQYKQSQTPIKMLYNMHYEGSQVDFTSSIKENELQVIGVVKYEESSIDNVDLNASSFKVFKSKSKNFETYEGIVKSLDI